MKTIFLVMLIAISFSFAYSEIPDSIKLETKQLYSSNNLNEKTISKIISDMANQKLIKNTIDSRHIYLIPRGGETDFVKITGRIDEYGKTSKVDLQINRPDRNSENISSPLLETGRYSTLYPINGKSLPGTYQIVTKFGGETKSISYFHLTKVAVPESNFPLWLLRNFEWWSQDKISDTTLVNSIQHLADLGLIVTSSKPSTQLQVVVTGEELVRRGTTHTINVMVTNGYLPIEGAKVTLTIEDYGENIIRDFDGLTDQNGNFVFSWEIPKSFDDYETLLAYISVSGNGSSQTHLWKFQIYCLPGTANCKIDGN
jgi:predicted transcriptional regulator